ncbi:ArsR/SmtB family transcription factor [Catenuloplanes sp. NPDC051500]|uniref:ArsR/SmtB family transcription factor n=1 Tax=Catenuloplanes sp. NPDC051500 TaxID=3363959 RepID=UPI0037919B93
MDADVAAAAGLFADRTRASVIAALLDGRSLTAGELARSCDVSAATISAHLRRLLDAGLVAVSAQGRHRYYRLADERAGRAFEALAVLAPVLPVRSLRQSRAAASLRAARTCYDHLAGHAGVRLAEALVSRGILGPGGFALLAPAELTSFGVDVAAAERSRRSFAHPCLDWSERRHHLAGALGAALLDRLVTLEWLVRDRSSRAVRVTDAGHDGLRSRFGCDLTVL